MPTSADPVTAVSEADAQGEIADIFDDIRQTLGVDVVNLVWRHLATIDRALPWAWECVRPAYLTGAVATEAQHMKQKLILPQLPKLTPDLLATSGVSSDSLSSISAIQRSYDRSNSMNFLALAALADCDINRLTDYDGASGSKRQAEQTARLGVLPALPPLNETGPELYALLERLNRLAQVRDDAIMVSMYRQLSYWPAYLEVVWTLIAPIAEDGRLHKLVTATEKAACPHIDLLKGQLDVAEEHLAAKAALRNFLERVNLPKMIVITRMLTVAISSADQSWKTIESPLS
jgi:hypothetical protein